MKIKALQAMSLLAVFSLGAASTASADVQLTMQNGRVSVVAKDATVRQILTEWAASGRRRSSTSNGSPAADDDRTAQRHRIAGARDPLAPMSGYIAAPRAGRSDQRGHLVPLRPHHRDADAGERSSRGLVRAAAGLSAAAAAAAVHAAAAAGRRRWPTTTAGAERHVPQRWTGVQHLPAAAAAVPGEYAEPVPAADHHQPVQRAAVSSDGSPNRRRPRRSAVSRCRDGRASPAVAARTVSAGTVPPDSSRHPAAPSLADRSARGSR